MHSSDTDPSGMGSISHVAPASGRCVRQPQWCDITLNNVIVTLNEFCVISGTSCTWDVLTHQKWDVLVLGRFDWICCM